MRKFMNIAVMTLAGLFLIVATGLKFHQMLNECIPSWQDNPTGFWESYEFFLIQIPLEFALGVWMVSGLFRKAAWLAGTAAYFAFIFVTLAKVITGAETCGCFGQIHVDPMITLCAIDIPFFVLLAIFWPKGGKLLPPPWPNLFYMAVVAAPIVAVMVLAPSMLVTFKPECIKVEEKASDEGALERLEKWRQEQDKTKVINNSADILNANYYDSKAIVPGANIHAATQLQGSLMLEPTDVPDVFNLSVFGNFRKLSDPGNLIFSLDLRNPEKMVLAPGEHKKRKFEVTQDGKIEVYWAKDEQPSEPEDKEPEVIEPEQVDIPQWDWLQYVVEEDVREAISSVLVIVMMHRHDCIVCEEMSPAYSEYYGQMVADGDDNFKIAFLEIPEYGDDSHVPDDTLCPSGRLSDQQKFQIMSPYVVLLIDGQFIYGWPRGTAPQPDTILDELDKVLGQ
jgi:hypothetical protein